MKGEGRGGTPGGPPGAGLGSGMAFARDGRTLYVRTRDHLFAARQVTYTANLEVDHKTLRAQVFNEGWRIMKNRFYDAKMHRANWNAIKEMYEPLENLVDEDELHTIMMMIGHLNASHTGVSGGPNPMRATVATRHPGFDVVSDP